MAGAPAYRYQEPARNPRRAPQQSPRIQVVPGRGKDASEALSPVLVTIAKMLCVALIVFALIGFVRIGLASAAVETALASEKLSTEIENSRAKGNELEVRQSYLSTSSHIQLEATRLGLSEAEATTLNLPNDIVALDAQGNLSLSLTINAAAQG